MRVILAAGGSGGHIFPAVALAEELEQRGVKEIFFVSSKRRLDKNILSGTKYKSFFLSVNPMPLKVAPIRFIVFAAKFLADIAASLCVIARVRPHVVVGFGGYATGTIVLCAKIFSIPVLVHEQNFVPGRANKILGKIADVIAVSFEGSDIFFPKAKGKIVFSGNPLRMEMLVNDKTSSMRRLDLSDDKSTILVMGGSQGSSFLNRTVSKAAGVIRSKMSDRVQFVHLTGEKDYEKIKDHYAENNISAKVFSFLENIDDAYAVSDVVVSRSGAAAVFELAYYAKPMILVPYPNPKNNQRSNAEYFSEKGAAVYKKEKELSSESLAEEVLGIIGDRQKCESLSKAASALSVPDAGRRLAKEVMKLARK